MNSPDHGTGSHTSEPVRTPENPLDYKWLTVEEAVAFCAERGLSRTPKTLRKWAERSYNKEDADIIVRRADTMWGGYRWKIEQASLSRKVDEELSLAGSNSTAPVRTGANAQADADQNSAKQIQVHPVEPVRTGVAMFPQPKINSNSNISDEPGANPSELVRTGSLDIRPAEPSTKVLEEVRERLRDKDAEIAFLRDQLGKAQAEVERRATSTDDALKSIDRVVRSFEMQAEANKALALRGLVTQEPVSEKTEPIRFTPDAVQDTEDHAPATEEHAPNPHHAVSWDRV